MKKKDECLCADCDYETCLCKMCGSFQRCIIERICGEFIAKPLPEKQDEQWNEEIL
jgi:hypothetical protein